MHFYIIIGSYGESLKDRPSRPSTNGLAAAPSRERPLSVDSYACFQRLWNQQFIDLKIDSWAALHAGCQLPIPALYVDTLVYIYGHELSGHEHEDLEWHYITST